MLSKKLKIMNINPSALCDLNSDRPAPIENPALEPPIAPLLPHSSTPSVSRRRTGKVASLPKAERDLVNQLLEDGSPYDAIVQALALRGFTVSSRNISNWFQGGYQDWLLLQQRIATHQLHEEAALDILNDRDIDVAAAGLQIVATHLCQVLLASQPLRVDPQSGLDNYLRAANTICRITHQLIQIQKFHDEYPSDPDATASDTKTKNSPPSAAPVVHSTCPVVPLPVQSKPTVAYVSSSKAAQPSGEVSPLPSPPDEAHEGEADVAPAPAPPLFEGRVTTSLPRPSDGRGPGVRAISLVQNPEPKLQQSGLNELPLPTTVAYGNPRQPQKSLAPEPTIHTRTAWNTNASPWPLRYEI
jgi:hypothetical protein